MSPKLSLLFLIAFLNLNTFILSEEEKVNYEQKTISNLRSSVFNALSDGFYYVGNQIEEGKHIIGFSDLNGDKMTDIITYDKEGNNYSFYVHYYEKEGDGKFKNGEKLFSIQPNDSTTDVRNIFIGSFFDNNNEACYVVSFNLTTEVKGGNLTHYLVCKNGEKVSNLYIYSNILFFNAKSTLNPKILYYDYTTKTRKICTINDDYNCANSEFSEIFTKCTTTDTDDYASEDLSLKGGMAFVDIDGDCKSDVILTHDSGDVRYIEIYKSLENNGEITFCLANKNVIKLKEKDKYGAFTLAKINDNKDTEIAPMFDLIIPFPKNNSVLILYNKRHINYEWADNYCENNENNKNVEQLYENDYNQYSKIENLTLNEENVKNIIIDDSYPTIIRMGDYLSTSNPGILLKQNIYYNDGTNKTYISLYQRNDKKYSLNVKFEKTNLDNSSDIKMGLFFDIDETGSLGVIVVTENKNHFFFNSRKTVFFLKSKLMKSQKNYFNTDLGTTYRYIVTNKEGNRHMDISQQLAQTSDMNMALPYSLMGLDQINNYVENFHTISSCYLNNEAYSSGSKNYKLDTPIIPNTQMMIYKFINGNNKIEWSIDLIVQPMDKLWLILALVIVVLIIVLAIIIYLHVKEVKEEQKETTKFKSWFA